MWIIAQALDENDVPLESSRRERFTKKYPDAVALLDDRMQRLRILLDGGMPLPQAMTSIKWVHREQSGVHAIAVKDPPLRLYFLPFPDKRILLTLTIGDKNRQAADVIETASWAKMVMNK